MKYALIQLLLDRYDLSECFDNDQFHIRMLSRCTSQEMLRVALRSQLLSFAELSVEEKFEFALYTGEAWPMDVSVFLGMINIKRSNKMLLASLKGSTGATLLRCVAKHLWNCLTFAVYDAIQPWLDPGSFVLRNGADPCAVARTHDVWKARYCGSFFAPTKTCQSMNSYTVPVARPKRMEE
jgi:hypothetical protein